MSIFYVYQGKTYKLERDGGYVWSPKLTKNGSKNAGYTMMTNIRKGDVILHNCDKKIMAISIAQSDCEDGTKPPELNSRNEWDNDGYIVKTAYKEFSTPVIVTNYQNWLKENHKPNSAFTEKGQGKQQYMCALDEEHAVYLLEEIIKLQSGDIKVLLKDILGKITAEDNVEYLQSEKDDIDSLIKNESGPIPSWSAEFSPQELTISNSTEREIPKRNIKIAVDALRRANHRCEYDINDRVFERKSGKGYTEPHHLIPLSKYRDFDYKTYSLDVMENIVSLCSHCHNLLHYGKLEDKRPMLEKLYKDRKEALKQVGLEISFEKLESYYR